MLAASCGCAGRLPARPLAGLAACCNCTESAPRWCASPCDVCLLPARCPVILLPAGVTPTYCSTCAKSWQQTCSQRLSWGSSSRAATPARQQQRRPAAAAAPQLASAPHPASVAAPLAARQPPAALPAPMMQLTLGWCHSSSSRRCHTDQSSSSSRGIPGCCLRKRSSSCTKTTTATCTSHSRAVVAAAAAAVLASGWLFDSCVQASSQQLLVCARDVQGVCLSSVCVGRLCRDFL